MLTLWNLNIDNVFYDATESSRKSVHLDNIPEMFMCLQTAHADFTAAFSQSEKQRASFVNRTAENCVHGHFQTSSRQCFFLDLLTPVVMLPNSASLLISIIDNRFKPPHLSRAAESSAGIGHIHNFH